MSKDRLEICDKCGSDACYVTEVNQDINNYFCYGCGFQSNSLMKEDSPMVEEQLEIMPELYKDLGHLDEKGKIWFPSTVNLPHRGMIFANGTSAKHWGWSAVKAVKVTEEEKSKYPIPGKKGEYYEHRMDMSTKKDFDDRGFVDALTYIGLIPE